MSKLKSILYFCDILGLEPKLKVFGNDSYKSTFGSILSIIVLFLAATFTVYSLIVYFNYVNPSIVYSKDNDKSTKRNIKISESLLMFGLYENTLFSVLDQNNAFIETNYTVEYNNGSYYVEKIILENCKYGKNIDEEYQESLKNYNISEYYCFNKTQGNLPLFYLPDVGKSYITLNIRLGKNSSYTANDVILYIMNGNDVIDHSSKSNPISNNYFSSTYAGFSTSKFNIINYYFQFIKYESDDGFLFPNSEIFNAKAFSQMSIMETNYIEAMDKNEIGTVFISFSEINFDSYKRVYPRIQSLLAEVMSVINILMAIGQILTKIIIDKKMSKDIFKYIVEKEYKKRKIEIIPENNEIIPKEINIPTTTENEQITYKSTQNNIDNISNKNSDNKNSNSKLFDSLNYIYIIKSFFCCEDAKTKFINACHDYISKEICIENILHKLNELINKLNIIFEVDSFKIENPEFEEIKKKYFYTN